MTSIAVLVPTVDRREVALRRCLDALGRQSRPPDQLIIVRNEPSYVGALRAGWRQVETEWVALLDDDAEPQSDWLARIETHIGDPSLGAVGGRILNVVNGRTTARNYTGGYVARLNWFGRTTSRLQDIPYRPICQDVDFLPGSNMCIRYSAMPDLDPNLDFGMAPGFELGVCLALQRAGWIVRFDSELLVVHYPDRRPDEYDRANRARYAHEYSRVTTYSILRNVSWPRKVAFAVYFALVGQRESPGLAMAPYFLLTGLSRQRMLAAWRGKLEGLVTAIIGYPQ